MNIAEIQEELFRLEYPNLSPDHDPDIERYFFLRNAGRFQEAMTVFQNRIIPRYPHPQLRTDLIRCYRCRSPQFRELLAIGYRLLGRRALERIRKVLAYIAQRIEGYNPKDVYSTIKTAEDILGLLPRERYEALAGMDRYVRYAEALEFNHAPLLKASDLIQAYLTQNLSVVESERRRREEKKRREEEERRRLMIQEDWAAYGRLKGKGGAKAMLDLSSVVFSAADLARIEIPDRLVKLEDQTLAYCMKYWNLVNDAAFDRVLFLYSRKYNKKNYDAYQAIRRGRAAKNRDDEILSAVLAALVTGYYYSIQGDRYLQRTWLTLKPMVERGRKALPAPETKAAAKPAAAREVKPAAAVKSAVAKPVAAKPVAARPVTVVEEAGPAAKIAPAKRTMTEGAARTASAPRIAPPKAKPVTAPKTVVAVPAAAAAAKPAAAEQAPRVAPPKAKPAAAAEPAAPRAARLRTAAAKPQAGGSVSDRLRQLSGRSYDLYQAPFLAKARLAIRKVLSSGRGIFFSTGEEEENLIYNFLRDHYSDPYMNWKDSPEHKRLAELGYTLDSLNPVIDECYKRIS